MGDSTDQEDKFEMGCEVLFRVRPLAGRGCMAAFLGVNHVGGKMNIISPVLTFFFRFPAS